MLSAMVKVNSDNAKEAAEKDEKEITALIQSMTEISTGSAEQANDIQQISKAMFQLDQSSQSNAFSAQKIATDSNEVNTLAIDALELSHELNTIILGDKKAA